MQPLQIEHAPQWVLTTMESEVGVAVLFGLAILEGAMLLRFMPSELVVPTALAFVGTSPFEVVIVVTTVVIGTTVGQAVLFAVVRRGGREFVLGWRMIPISEGRLDRFDAWFDRWGRVLVPLSNTLLFVRGLFTFPAGLSDMNLRTFVALSALGSLSFQSILAGVYLFSRSIVLP